MDLGLDGRNHFAAGGGTGVATYAVALAEAMCRLGHRPGWLLGDGSDDGPREPHDLVNRVRRIARAALPVRRAVSLRLGSSRVDRGWLSPDIFRVAQVHFDLYRRPLALRMRTPPALMHWTSPLPLRSLDVPQVLTIHDLIPVETPDLTGIRADRHDRLIRSLLLSVSHIATVSETVRTSIIQRYDVPADRVVTTFQSVELSPALLRQADHSSMPPGVPSHSFIAIGSVERRKNIARLIRAHAGSRTKRPLIIVGPDGEDAASEMATITSHPHPERIIRLPWLPRPVLVGLLREARALLFPSLAEGFGLPIVEAMTLGTPVLTSRGGATEEIAGGAALVVDPIDEMALTGAIVRLDIDDSLCATLSAAGRQRAGFFTPEHYSDRLADLYKRTLALPAPILTT